MNKHKLRIYSRERITDKKGRRFEEKKKGPEKPPGRLLCGACGQRFNDRGEVVADPISNPGKRNPPTIRGPRSPEFECAGRNSEKVACLFGPQEWGWQFPEPPLYAHDVGEFVARKKVSDHSPDSDIRDDPGFIRGGPRPMEV